MVSPAAKTLSRPVTRRYSSTSRKPRASSGKPVFASQRAGAACVVQRISSAATGARPARMRRPFSTPVTVALAMISIPRDARMSRKRARKAGGNVGRMSGVSETSRNDSPSGSKPRCAASPRRRRSTESRSSTPPAPAPTSATRACARCSITRASRASNRARKPSIGLTGMACAAAPGTSAVFGVDPMLSDTRS